MELVVVVSAAALCGKAAEMGNVGPLASADEREAPIAQDRGYEYKMGGLGEVDIADAQQ